MQQQYATPRSIKQEYQAFIYTSREKLSFEFFTLGHLSKQDKSTEFGRVAKAKASSKHND